VKQINLYDSESAKKSVSGFEKVAHSYQSVKMSSNISKIKGLMQMQGLSNYQSLANRSQSSSRKSLKNSNIKTRHEFSSVPDIIGG